MNNPSGKVSELENAIGEFVRNFQLVFHDDWDFTLGTISDRNFAESRWGGSTVSNPLQDSPSGDTFISPKVNSSKDSNWDNYENLLHYYGELIEVLEKYSIPHSVEDWHDGLP